MKATILAVATAMAALVPVAPSWPAGLTIEQAQELVRDNLRDPESARFRNVQAGRLDGEDVVCGLVNAKNAYGGYAGFHAFLVHEDGKVLMDSDADPDGLQGTVGLICSVVLDIANRTTSK